MFSKNLWIEKFNKINKNYKNNLRNEKKLFFWKRKIYYKFFRINRFKEIYKERNVNSIYFDDFKLTKLLDTVDGEKYRSKIRLRWYGKIEDIHKNLY